MPLSGSRGSSVRILPQEDRCKNKWKKVVDYNWRSGKTSGRRLLTTYVIGGVRGQVHRRTGGRLCPMRPGLK